MFSRSKVFELFVRLFVRSYKPHALQTMALFGANYGSFLLKVPQTLIAGTSNAGSVYGVQCFLTVKSSLLKDFHTLWPLKFGSMKIIS